MTNKWWWWWWEAVPVTHNMRSSRNPAKSLRLMTVKLFPCKSLQHNEQHRHVMCTLLHRTSTYSHLVPHYWLAHDLLSCPYYRSFRHDVSIYQCIQCIFVANVAAPNSLIPHEVSYWLVTYWLPLRMDVTLPTHPWRYHVHDGFQLLRPCHSPVPILCSDRCLSANR